MPPTVEVLGVRVAAHRPKKREARRFVEVLGAHGPRVVQAMDARTMEGAGRRGAGALARA